MIFLAILYIEQCEIKGKKKKENNSCKIHHNGYENKKPPGKFVTVKH